MSHYVTISFSSSESFCDLFESLIAKFKTAVHLLIYVLPWSLIYDLLELIIKIYGFLNFSPSKS